MVILRHLHARAAPQRRLVGADAGGRPALVVNCEPGAVGACAGPDEGQVIRLHVRVAAGALMQIIPAGVLLNRWFDRPEGVMTGGGLSLRSSLTFTDISEFLAGENQ